MTKTNKLSQITQAISSGFVIPAVDFLGISAEYPATYLHVIE